MATTVARIADIHSITVRPRSNPMPPSAANATITAIRRPKRAITSAEIDAGESLRTRLATNGGMIGFPMKIVADGSLFLRARLGPDAQFWPRNSSLPSTGAPESGENLIGKRGCFAAENINYPYATCRPRRARYRSSRSENGRAQKADLTTAPEASWR